MEQLMTRERKKELLELHEKRQRYSKWSDTLAIAAFLYVLVCLFFNRVDLVCCITFGVLMIASLVLFFAFNRCPNCNALMMNRRKNVCKKCGLEIASLSKQDYAGHKKKKKK